VTDVTCLASAADVTKAGLPTVVQVSSFFPAAASEWFHCE